MYQFRSKETQKIIEDFMGRSRQRQRAYQQAPIWYHWFRQQEEQAKAQAAPEGEGVIDAPFVVIDESRNRNFEQQLQKIRKRQQAVYRLDWPMIVALALAVFFWLGSWYWSEANRLASWVLGMQSVGWCGWAVLYWYLKVTRAATAKCPNCGRPFGSRSWVPLTRGKDRCQRCNLPLEIIGLEGR